jgi:hypothetical protein
MKLFFSLLLALGVALSAHAGPGAHGPDGEHLDSHAAGGGAGQVPRVETFSELFELVGHLSGGEFSVLIDRYDTNAPVLGGQLEVQYKDLKAKATFHSDAGDYAIDDARLLKALSVPGKHPLLFTVIAGEESDLLEGTLVVAAQPHAHDHDDAASRWWWLLALPLAGAAVALLAWIRRRNKEAQR